MSTPNTSNPSQPSSASKKHGGHVSTPSRLPYTSPAPRSVPSPAATRKDQAGKTPVNHPTTGSSQGSKTLGGTPMVPTLSQTSNNALGTSPGIMTGGSASGGILSFGTPVGLGVEGITPGGGMMSLPQQGGTAMNLTMSDLGLTASSGFRNEDEERKAKLRHILQRIGRDSHMGRVSEEGIARVARRVGFANDIDAETLTPEERVRKVGNRSISIAGNGIVVDVELRKGDVQGVQVIFDSSNTALTEERAPEISNVLKRDLKRKRSDLDPEDDSLARGPKLDSFAENMERLARVDRLSLNSVNCFEALSGIYGSLKRLHEAEKKVTEAKGEEAELEVMCKKSGRPKINANGRLGLWLDYWQNSRQEVGEDSQMVDVNGEGTNILGMSKESHLQAAPNDSDTFRLHIEVESYMPGMYDHPLRVSDLWLPDPLELPSFTSATANDMNTENEQRASIPWEDPPPTMIPPRNSGTDAMAVDGASNEEKLPELRFVARLDPPIVLPYNSAALIFGVVDLNPPVLYATSPHYQTAVLHPAAALGTVANEPVLRGEKSVVTAQGSEAREVKHNYFVEFARPEYGVVIEELPFKHPQQLIGILPTLRQWASFGSLLKNVVQNPEKGDNTANGNTQRLTELSLADLLTPPMTPENSDDDPTDVSVSITFVTSPLPTLGIEFPGVNGQVERVCVQVGINGEVSIIIDQSDDNDAEVQNENKGITDAKVAREMAAALELCGNDLGVWIEWLRRRTVS